MFFQIDHLAARDGGDFVNAIAELKGAVLDMHARRAMRQIAAIDIGNTTRRRARRRPLFHSNASIVKTLMLLLARLRTELVATAYQRCALFLEPLLRVETLC